MASAHLDREGYCLFIESITISDSEFNLDRFWAIQQVGLSYLLSNLSKSSKGYKRLTLYQRSSGSKWRSSKLSPMWTTDTYRRCITQLIYLNVVAIHPPLVTTSYGYMAMLYCPSQIFQTQFAYTARFCRNSSRNQLTAKGARRVDGQNSSAVTSKINSDYMAKFACSPLAKMPAGCLPLKPYCMCLSFSVVFCPENAKPHLQLDPSQLLICVSPRQNRLRYVQQSDCGVVMTALSQNTPEISWPQTKYLLRRRGDH